jgi:hypothetical protein
MGSQIPHGQAGLATLGRPRRGAGAAERGGLENPEPPGSRRELFACKWLVLFIEEATFICECARRDCIEQITMTLGQYEELRRIPTHFAVAPNDGHFFPEVERVIDRMSSYWVVEKFGDAGIEAVRRDPRAASGNHPREVLPPLAQAK